MAESRYGQLKVDRAALPGARLTAAETPGSEGEGAAHATGQAGVATGQALEQLGATATGIGTHLFAASQAAERKAAEDAQNAADDVAVMAAKNHLALWSTNRMNAPGTGALAQQGQQAFGLPDQIDSEFVDQTSAIEAGLNDRQKAKFAGYKQSMALDLHTTVLRHVSSEMQTWESQELNNRIANGQNAAIVNADDPRVVKQQLDDVVLDLKKSGPRLGMGPAQLDAKIRQVQSATVVGVVERLLADGKPDKAQWTFDENKGGLSGDDAGKLEKALAVGHTRNAAQKLSDAISAKGGTISEQIQAVKDAGAEGETRDEAIRYLKENRDVAEKQARDDQEALVSKAFATVDQTHSLRSIAPADIAKLGSHVETLRHYAEFLNKGEAVPTDWGVYAAQMLRASSDPQAFARDNPMALRDQLGDAEFKQLTEIRAAIVKTGNADKELTDYRQHNELIDNSLTQYGFDVKAADKDPTSASGLAKAELHRLVNQAVATQETQTKKKATTEDVQSAIDRILGTSRTVKGSWWGLFPYGGPLRDTTQHVLSLTIADVPPAQQEVIKRQLKLAGAAVNDVTVLDAYQTLLTRQRVK